MPSVRQRGRYITSRLVTVLVLSRLDYCNALLAVLPASTRAPFQWPLHAAARTVLDLKPRDRVTSALQELHWLPVTETIQYKLCLLVHKSLLGHTSEYISDLLTPVSTICTACLVVWQPHHTTDMSTNQRQLLISVFIPIPLLPHHACMEQAADRLEVSAVDRLINKKLK